jgi:hypothetical protein
MNLLTLKFRCIDCNGLPQARIKLNDEIILDHQFTSVEESHSINIDSVSGDHVLTVERYNKQSYNMILEDGNIVQDQILEIIDVQVDDTSIPEFVIYENCEFSWDTQVHAGSRYFGPNGVWTYRFSTPIITHILDLKIKHESKYNQDYLFPWSYKLGPDSVATIVQSINEVEKKVNEVL